MRRSGIPFPRAFSGDGDFAYAISVHVPDTRHRAAEARASVPVETSHPRDRSAEPVELRLGRERVDHAPVPPAYDPHPSDEEVERPDSPDSVPDLQRISDREVRVSISVHVADRGEHAAEVAVAMR